MFNKVCCETGSNSISIITATFNAVSTLADCLQSVSSQSVPVEHLIIDGGSTDNSLEVVRKLSPKARILSEPDFGVYDAMNKGIALATGDVVGILNADDFYVSPSVLEKVLNLFKDPQVMSCYGDLEYVAEQGSPRDEPGKDCSVLSPPFSHKCSRFKVVRYWKSGLFSPVKFYWGWMPPHPTFFVRRSVYEQYGRYRLDFGSAADYEMMLRLLLKFQLSTAYIPEVLVRMRNGGSSNRNLSARLAANRMDRKAWKDNRLSPYPWTILCKPLRKLTQWLFLK